MNYKIENQSLELHLSLSKSNVIFQESSDDTVELEFAGLRKKTAEEMYTIRFRDNRLYIKENSARHSPVLDALLNPTMASDVLIKIPAQVAVSGKVKTIKGDIKAGKLQFQGELKTMTGKIVIDDIQTAGLEIQNIGGSIFIGNLTGAVRGKAVAGEFTIEKGVFSEVAISSVSGDIRLAGEFRLEMEGDISTVSGDVHLEVHQYQGENNLFLSTLSGNTSIVGDYPEGAIVIKPRMPFIKNHPFKTVMPSMKDMFSSFFSTADKSEVEVETETNVGASHADEGNVKMILEMLSQGKIKVEEAEKLIKALGQKK